MNLLLDNIIFQLQKSGGVSVYWKELISRLFKDPNLNCQFIGSSKNHSNFNVNSIDFNINNQKVIQSNDSIFGRYFPVFFKHCKQNFIFHSSYYRFYKKNKNVINLCNIYDFLNDIYFKEKYSLNIIMKNRAIKNSDFFICISHHAKETFLNLFPRINEHQIKVIHLAASENFKFLNTPKENYLLFVGRRDVRKNFDFVVNVIKNLPLYTLKIVGPPLTIIEIKYLNSHLKERWENVVFPNFDELNKIYNRATALIHASSFEGFGLTVLEAMQAGCPVIALKNTSIPEVAGEAGILIDHLKIDDFTSAVEHFKSGNNFYIRNGLEQAKKFSWDKNVNETLEFYKKIYSNF